MCAAPEQILENEDYYTSHAFWAVGTHTNRQNLEFNNCRTTQESFNENNGGELVMQFFHQFKTSARAMIKINIVIHSRILQDAYKPQNEFV